LVNALRKSGFPAAQKAMQSTVQDAIEILGQSSLDRESFAATDSRPEFSKIAVEVVAGK
jgi:hypothetical protein